MLSDRLNDSWVKNVGLTPMPPLVYEVIDVQVGAAA